MADDKGPRRAWSRTTWVLFLLIILTAASTLFEVRDPDLPGTLRLGVLQGGRLATPSALAPLSDYLGQEIHRRVTVETFTADALEASLNEFDFVLAPIGAVPLGTAKVLAWAKPAGRSGWRSSAGVLRARDAKWPPTPGARWILGDAVTWGGDHGARSTMRAWGFSDAAIDSCPHGADPYDHQGVIAALVHGAFDYAVVRESEVRQATWVGRLPHRGYVYTRVGEPRGEFGLVAGHALSESATRRLQEAALNLDHYRQDPSRLRARAASSALGLLSLAGFVPDELLPSLRP